MSLWETSVQKSPPTTSKLPLHPSGGYRKCCRNRIIEKDKNLNQWLNGPLCSHFRGAALVLCCTFSNGLFVWCFCPVMLAWWKTWPQGSLRAMALCPSTTNGWVACGRFDPRLRLVWGLIQFLAIQRGNWVHIYLEEKGKWYLSVRFSHRCQHL